MGYEGERRGAYLGCGGSTVHIAEVCGSLFLPHAERLQELSLRLPMRLAAVIGRVDSFSVLDSLERPWSCCFPPLEMSALDYLQH